MTDRMRTAFLRSQRKISTQLAVIDSSTEMQEVSVAKIVVTKKHSPTATPALPMAWNTLGSETNIRLGPALMPSVPVNTYTAGMIIAPAISATPVSNTSI